MHLLPALAGDELPTATLSTLSLEAYLAHLLRQRWAEALELPPEFDAPRYRAFADVMRHRARLTRRFPDPAQLVLRCGFSAIPCDVPGEIGEATRLGVVRFRWGGGPRERGLRLYRGLARCLLEEWFAPAHPREADVWLFAVEMACPRCAVALWGGHVMADAQLYAPLWLIAAVQQALPVEG